MVIPEHLKNKGLLQTHTFKCECPHCFFDIRNILVIKCFTNLIIYHYNYYYLVITMQRFKYALFIKLLGKERI